MKCDSQWNSKMKDITGTDNYDQFRKKYSFLYQSKQQSTNVNYKLVSKY